MNSDQSSGACPDGMDCAEAGRRVFAYIDGALTAEQVTQIERHLDECGHCHKMHEVERKLVDAIRDPKGSADVRALKARVLDALRASRPAD